MSRTWRQLPSQSRKRLPQHLNKKGGATASAGPSPERRRPDTDYDTEILHLATELLNHAAARLQTDLLDHNQPTSDCSTTQALWDAAADGDCPPDLLLPTLHVAHQAVGRIRDNQTILTPEAFHQASAFLLTMINAKDDNDTTRAKNVMVPDGRQRDSSIPFWRDDRVTGLRSADHRKARRGARQNLADPESAETVRAGKSRRYTDTYGDYKL